MKTSTPAAYEPMHRGVLALARVEQAGMKIDEAYLDTAIAETTNRINQLEEEMRQDEVWTAWQKAYKNGRSRPNMGSREQLGKVLFDVLGHEYKGEATATGRYGTGKDRLADIDSPFVKNFIELEELKKLRSTHLYGIKRELVNGFVHPMQHLDSVRTQRSSQSLPNMQNVNARNPKLAEIVRKTVVSRFGSKGRVVDIDFKAIEVMVGYCYHLDPVMYTYLTGGGDMHLDYAALCYKLNPAEVDKMTRYCAKNMMVFPQFYGSVWFQCAPNLWEAIRKLKLKTKDGMPLSKHLRLRAIRELGPCGAKVDPIPSTFAHHIKEVEKEMWERFQVYASWKKKWVEQYRNRGWFHTKTGFTISGVYGRNDVVNYPIQGSAFHCLLWSLITMVDWLRKNKMRSKVIGQIHDSMIIDLHKDEEQDVLTKAWQVTTKELPKHWKWIVVPLSVEVEASPLGGNWWDKKEWVNTNGTWGPREIA